jgi:hyperosmotically inducible periplasmic protein
LSFIFSTGVCAATTQLKQRPDEAQYRQKLAHEVRHQLVLLPYYSVFDNLEFSVKDDTVTLVGQVVRPTPKADAEAAAKRVEGVAQVVNNIEVLPAFAER